MIDLEQELRAALARQQPSPDFVSQIMARTVRPERPAVSWWQPWAAGCIAASMLIGALGLADLENRRQRERVLEARAQVLQALAITSGQLHRIQQKVENPNQ